MTITFDWTLAECCIYASFVVGAVYLVYYIAHDLGYQRGQEAGRKKASKEFDDALVAAQVELFRRDFHPPTIHPFEDRSSIPQGPSHGSVPKPDVR